MKINKANDKLQLISIKTNGLAILCCSLTSYFNQNSIKFCAKFVPNCLKQFNNNLNSALNKNYAIVNIIVNFEKFLQLYQLDCK